MPDESETNANDPEPSGNEFELDDFLEEPYYDQFDEVIGDFEDE